MFRFIGQSSSVLAVAFALLGFFGAVPSSWAGAAPHGRALFVGVNQYDDPNIQGLKDSVSDATMLSEILSDPTRGIFAKDQVRMLTDLGQTPDQKPTRLAILEGVQWLSEADADSTILLYFSGHGVVNDQGKQYLGCSDAKLSALSFTAVPIEEINALLDDPAKTKARRIIVIFDSCHSGVRRGSKATDSESGGVIESLMTQSEGRVTLCSCNSDELSYEDPDAAHSIFSYDLAEGLKGAADTNGDGLISVGELNVYVRQKVEIWAKAHGVSQTPRVQSNVSGDIVLARDPAKYAAGQQAASARRAALTQERSQLLQSIGAGTDLISVDDGAGLLRCLDRMLAGQGTADDDRREALVKQFCAGTLKTAALLAEVKALPSETAIVPAPSAAPLHVQIFQPQWEHGATDDDYQVTCEPGQEIKVVGLADSPHGITQVLLDGQTLKSASLGSKDLKLVSVAAQDNMRFEGTVHAGSAPSVSVLTVVDADGSHRLIQLHLQPQAITTQMAGSPGAHKDVVAVIGMNNAAVDKYETLHSLRIGQGLHQLLTHAAQDTKRFTLVEEKTDVLRGLIDNQWMQKSAAFDQATAVQTGKLLGAHYVIYGEVYDFASPKENKGKLYLAVQIRLVDVETARYVVGEGDAEIAVPKDESASTEFDRTTLSQVSKAAIQAALADLFKSAKDGAS